MSLQLTDTLSITLTAQEWNQVLGVLVDGRYSIVAPLIAKIHQQGQEAGGEIVATNGTGRHLNPGEGEATHVPDR